ncbi:MAG: M15 family metallopeptidase [Bacteroidia bacterium]|nr:M15 family metallopeptidase [Bacteroidia bacterium]
MKNRLLIWYISVGVWCACQPASPPAAYHPVASVVIQDLPSVIGTTEVTPFDTVDIRYLTGRFDPATDPLFARIPDAYTTGSARGGYLRQEALAAFEQLHAAALRDGVRLTILSATRNFDYQRRIWEDKWNGTRLVEGQNLARALPDPVTRARKILRYSAMPATSRHHWGTDFDLNALENSYFTTGEGLKVYTWLRTHAATFGFGQPYTAKGPARPEGYEEEKWHWSYLPLAKSYLATYTSQVTYADITGFAGDEAAPGLDVIQAYVQGIDPTCR